MANQNVCSWNKFGYCRYQDMCRSLHVKDVCVSPSCDGSNCMLRHPITCKFYTKYNRCKFNPCSFKHIENPSEDDIENLKTENKALIEKIEKIDENLKTLNEKEFESKLIIDKLKQLEEKFDQHMKEKDDRIEALENEIKDTNLKLFDQDKKFSILSKKFGVLREKMYELDKETEVEKNPEPSNLKSSDPESQSQNVEFECEKCQFTAKSDAALKTHIRSKHFTCWTCNFICNTKEERTTHNEKYWYSHRMALNRNHKKYILEEFEELKKDSFTVNVNSINEVSNWPTDL